MDHLLNCELSDLVAGDPVSTGNEPRAEFIARMEAEGFRVDLPAANELQVDIDTAEQYLVFKERFETLKRNFDLASSFTWKENASKSGGPRKHIRIELPWEVSSEWERIAWQAGLGGDSLRELRSCVRLAKGDEHPSLLVEKP